MREFRRRVGLLLTVTFPKQKSPPYIFDVPLFSEINVDAVKRSVDIKLA